MPIDNILTQLSGIEKPEQKKVLEADIDLVKSIHNAYILWTKTIKPIFYDLRPFYDRELKRLLDEAERILQPYADYLPEIIDQSEYFEVISNNFDRFYGGIFYSALLNVGQKERKMILPRNIDGHCWGYGLKKGCLKIEIYDTYAEVGMFAQGGCITNIGEIHLLGRRSTGGLFVNYGYVGCYRPDCNTIFINKGTARYSTCFNVISGTLIDYNLIDQYPSGKLFLAVNSGGQPLAIHPKTKFIDQKQIQDDAALNKLIMELKRATEYDKVREYLKINKEEINTIVKKIEKHCEQK